MLINRICPVVWGNRQFLKIFDIRYFQKLCNELVRIIETGNGSAKKKLSTFNFSRGRSKDEREQVMRHPELSNIYVILSANAQGFKGFSSSFQVLLHGPSCKNRVKEIVIVNRNATPQVNWREHYYRESHYILFDFSPNYRANTKTY